MSRQFDFVYAGSYAPECEPGYRWHEGRNVRADYADQKRRERAFATLQRIRTFDWAFAQSGMLVTPDRNLAFGSSARALAA